MRIFPYQLASQLKHALLPCYLLMGDEPLLIQESKAMIRHALKQAGHHERHAFHITQDFDWDLFLAATTHRSLFGDQTVIELNFTQKPSTLGSKLLSEYVVRPCLQKCLLMTFPKLDANTQKAAWYKQIDASGAIIPIYPIEKKHLPQWTAQRLNKANLTLDKQGIAELIALTEGNLLSLDQEITKLQLIFGNKPISAEDILTHCVDTTCFTVFALVDALLQQTLTRALHILQQLKSEGTEVLLILWAIVREFRNLIHLQHHLNQGSSIEMLCKKNRVPEKQVSILKLALTKHSSKKIHAILLQASQIDYMIKGLSPGRPWEAMRRFITDICHP